MAKVNITKKDIIWSFIAQIFNVGTGLFTLPLILNKLSAEEIGFNYLMMTVSTIVALLDFGFAPQFSRNITYVFAGAQELKKEGISEKKGEVSYRLVAQMIGVAKMVYRILAVISFLIMITGGTWYIYYITDGFTRVNNSFLIWIIFCISIFFNVYYVYFSSLLMGKGLVMESRKASIAQRGSYLVLTYLFLFIGWGLMGVVIANLISPFIGRFISYLYFFNEEMKEKLQPHQPTKKEKYELFKIIWYNAKKLGLVFVGAYAVNRLGMFFAGLFLTLEEVASYGLMIQIGSILVGMSMTYFNSEQPKFASLRTENQKETLLTLFGSTLNIFYIFMILGFAFTILFGPWVLRLIGSNAVLPSSIVIIVYGIILLLENNHSAFATFIVTENKIPFMESSLIAGSCICVGSYLILKFTNFGLLGLLGVQGICQLAYSNWKWPYVVCKEFKINFLNFIYTGFVYNIEKGLIFAQHKLKLRYIRS